MLTSSKIVTLAEAGAAREQLRAAGKRVVALSGSFDLLHAGHIDYIEDARAQGDALIVLLNSDASVRRYKGAGRPIIPEGDRARMLAALAAVDLVAIFDEVTPLAALDALRPEVYANGADWGADCVERPLIERYGGTLHLFDGGEAKRSSSALIDRIRLLADVPSGRAVFLNRTALARLPEEDVRAALVQMHSLGYLLVLGGAGGWVEGVLGASGITAITLASCPVEGTESTCAGLCADALLQIANAHHIVLNQSWLVTGVSTEADAARAANLRVIWIEDGGPEAFRTAVAGLSPASSAQQDI